MICSVHYNIRCPQELCGSADVCVYKPSSEQRASSDREGRRATRRLNQALSQLRTYPVTAAGEGVSAGRSGRCEMCGEVFRRGDWLRKLPCKHKVGNSTSSSQLHTKG